MRKNGLYIEHECCLCSPKKGGPSRLQSGIKMTLSTGTHTYYHDLTLRSKYIIDIPSHIIQVAYSAKRPVRLVHN